MAILFARRRLRRACGSSDDLANRRRRCRFREKKKIEKSLVVAITIPVIRTRTLRLSTPLGAAPKPLLRFVRTRPAPKRI